MKYYKPSIQAWDLSSFDAIAVYKIIDIQADIESSINVKSPSASNKSCKNVFEGTINFSLL